MDCHANLSDATVCAACDVCKAWYGRAAVTSKVHSNNKGAHDASTKGYLWVRDRSDAHLGSSAAAAAPSCQAIKTLAGASKDGAYWIDPDGKGSGKPLRLYCDMTRDGGGWTPVGQTNVQQNIYDKWLRASVNASQLQTPNITKGSYACINAVPMAVNSAVELRLSNQAVDRWIKWSMPAKRTTATWWNHAAGYAVINKAARATVTTRTHGSATGSCYQSVYGVMPLQQHGGSYPAATYNIAGNTSVSDWCMAVGVQTQGTSAHGFSQNRNGYDAPFNETSWPNNTYTATPWISVWLR